MAREVVYRNIALLGGLLLLANAFYFNRVEGYENISEIIELGVVPITMILASFLFKRNIVLAGIIFYFTSYASDTTYLLFDLTYDNVVVQYERSFRILGAIGLGLVVFAGTGTMNKLGDNWLAKKINKPELLILAVAILTFLSSTGIFLGIG